MKKSSIKKEEVFLFNANNLFVAILQDRCICKECKSRDIEQELRCLYFCQTETSDKARQKSQLQRDLQWTSKLES